MDDIGIIFIIMGAVAAILLLTYLLTKRFHHALFIAALAPFISAAFATDDPYDVELTYGAYIRITLALLAGTVGVIKYLEKRKTDNIKPPIEFILFFAFVVIAFASAVTSIDPTRSTSRAAMLLILLGFLLGLYAWLSEESGKVDQALNALFVLIVLLTFANVIILLGLGDYGWWREYPRFKGILSHPNTLGSFAMISYPMVLWKYSQSDYPARGFIASLLAILLLLHVLSGSRSSLIGAIVGLAVWAFVLRQRTKLLVIIFVVLASGAIISQTRLSGAFARDEPIGTSISTITGRTDLWEAALILLKERPVHGYGYGVGGRIFDDRRFYAPQKALWRGSSRISLHNGYLSAAVGVGLVGGTFWCIILLIPIVSCWSFPQGYRKALVISIISMCLTLNLTEGAIGSGSIPTSMFFWIFWAVGVNLRQSEMTRITKSRMQITTNHTTKRGAGRFS